MVKGRRERERDTQRAIEREGDKEKEVQVSRVANIRDKEKAKHSTERKKI